LHSATLSHFIINVLQHASIFSLSFGNGFQKKAERQAILSQYSRALVMLKSLFFLRRVD